MHQYGGILGEKISKYEAGMKFACDHLIARKSGRSDGSCYGMLDFIGPKRSLLPKIPSLRVEDAFHFT
jgi:thymidine phosphorylase